MTKMGFFLAKNRLNQNFNANRKKQLLNQNSKQTNRSAVLIKSKTKGFKKAKPFF